MHEVQITRAVAKLVFTNFAAATTVAATVAAVATLLHEATMQAAAPELHRAVVEKSHAVAAVVPTTTAPRRATLLPGARISSGKGPPLLRSSQEKPRPSDAHFGVAGPYHF